MVLKFHAADHNEGIQAFEMAYPKESWTFNANSMLQLNKNDQGNLGLHRRNIPSACLATTTTENPIQSSIEASRISVVLGATTDTEASQDSAASSQAASYASSQASLVSSMSASRVSVVLGATTDAEASQDSVASAQLASDDSSQSSIASVASVSVASASAAGQSMVPKPTASILGIWDVPPDSGQPEYFFYDVPAGFQNSLDDNCGSPSDSQENLLSSYQLWEIDDPKQGRIDDIRPATVQRQAPGLISQSGSNCVYEEDEINNATVSCKGRAILACSPPSPDLAATVEPNNGSCGGIQDVRMLIMVCPYGDGI